MYNITSGHSWGGSYISLEVDDRVARNFIYGLDEMEQDSALREGLKKGAEVFKRKGRSNLRSLLSGSSSTGNLMGSFRVFAEGRILRAKAGFSSKGNHAHLVDLGTRVRKNKRGANRGIMPANNFWQDARHTEEEKAEQAVYDGIKKAVERIKNRA